MSWHHGCFDQVYANGSLVVWCEENGQLPPNDEKHRMFVIGYDCGENYFRLFVSTRYLLSFAGYSDCIHIDATYKLIWNGYPGFVVGITDSERAFHPLGFGICSSESTEDFRFIFLNLAKGVEQLFGPQCKTKFLVADGSQAITCGFKEAFGYNPMRVMCWYHMITAVDKQILLVREKENRVKIREDIQHMHYALSEKEFKYLRNYFLRNGKV